MVKKINEFKELQKKKGKKGFSMIELIIVIAIMAILIALIGTQLIPYLEKSRKSKDLTTMDTCLTNFQSALADCEVDTSSGCTYTGIANLPTTPNVKAKYEELAGNAYDDDTKLNNSFKSDASDKTSSNIIFAVAGANDTYGVPAGMIYVVKGDLIACSQYSGELNSNGQIP